MRRGLGVGRNAGGLEGWRWVWRECCPVLPGFPVMFRLFDQHRSPKPGSRYRGSSIRVVSLFRFLGSKGVLLSSVHDRAL